MQQRNRARNEEIKRSRQSAAMRLGEEGRLLSEKDEKC